MTSHAPQSVRLARYLRELVQSKLTVVRDVEKYDTCLWLSDIPEIDACRSAARSAHAEDLENSERGVWLRIEEPDVPAPPQPSPELAPWVPEDECASLTPSPPRLLGEASIPDPMWDPDSDTPQGRVSARLDDQPGIEPLHRRYCNEWRDWAEELKMQLDARRIYNLLYSVHRKLAREGESLELLMGLGLLDWRTPRGGAVPLRRHVLTASATLHFDPRRGVLEVCAPTEGVQINREFDFLGPELAPTRRDLGPIEELMDALREDEAIWENSTVLPLLQALGRIIDPKTDFSPDIGKRGGDAERAQITWAPALIVRRRNASGTLRMFEAIEEDLLRAGGRAPKGWAQLLDDPTDAGTKSSAADDSPTVASTAPERLYFPLPANRQQKEIISTLGNTQGVVVQGPPGTGKSHTIANLMCHLLATGQRVLVTAENPRALAVLRDKLPESLRALCISQLGHGGDAFKELSSTIQEISSRRARWREYDSVDAIAGLQKKLKALDEEILKFDKQIRDVRLGETVVKSFGGRFHGTPSAIAREVGRAGDRWTWLTDTAGTNEEPPIDAESCVRWLNLTMTIAPDAEKLSSRTLPNLAQLPSAADARQQWRALEDLEVQIAQYKAESALPLAGRLMAFSRDMRSELRTRISDARRQSAKSRRLALATEAFDAATSGEAGRLHAMIEEMRSCLGDHLASVTSLAGPEVFLPKALDPRQVKSDAVAVSEHLSAGGKWKSMFGLSTPKAVKGREYLRQTVTVAGSVADEYEELLLVAVDCDRRLHAARTIQKWCTFAGAELAEDQGIALRSVEHDLQLVEDAIERGNAVSQLQREIEQVADAQLAVDWLQSDTPDLIRVLDAADIRALLDARVSCEHQLMEQFDELCIDTNIHPAALAARDAVVSRDVSAFARALEDIESAVQTRRLAAERVNLWHQLEAGLPSLATDLFADPKAEHWEDRLSSLPQAWPWKRATEWLESTMRPGRLQELERNRSNADKQRMTATAELASELAWEMFFKRLSTSQDKALKGWLDTVRQMGKGKGRSAKLERLRRTARRHMDACRDAIPVWIMPRYLVTESIDATSERFDTVIVDEASQMGVDGLFLFYVGKRAIIVGDDQQISPSDVGMKDEVVDRIRREHIPDLTNAQALGRGGNVYGNAKIHFPRTIVLAEHFRCMPEIIAFSNDLCYAPHGTPLDPMRSFGEDRMQPLKSFFVANGQREGKTSPTNAIEAEAIVHQIETCIASDEYAGKSIGVISLVGNKQAKLIESILVARLGADVCEDHRILCGDSFAFQGDEREIIFLSMVVAPGETRLVAQTSAPNMQRFNVAVSRAQDQLWVFHSVELADLKPNCLRSQLLRHVRHPRRALADLSHMEFDSPFEEEVYEAIAARGYRAVTQVAVGNNAYRIDIVVEGVAGKLAVECDGERWHGPDRFEADMARQRDLERVGWEFYRIAGGDFYRDRVRALAPLWHALEERGILPRVEETESEPPTSPLSSNESTPAPLQPGVGLNPAEVPESSEATAGEPPIPPSGDEPAIASTASDGLAFPDPRQSDNRAEIRKSLVELVRVHGPLTTIDLHRRYSRGANIRRVGHVIKQALSNAVRSCLRAGLIESITEKPERTRVTVVRITGTPQVVLRPLGDREFDDVPLQELAGHIQTAHQLNPRTCEDDEALFRDVLTELEMTGLTAKRRRTLELALALRRRLDVPV